MYNLSFQPTASVSSGSAFVVCSIHRFCLVTGSEEEHSPVLKTLERSAARKMPSKSLEDISSDSSSENKVCPAVHASPKLPNARVLSVASLHAGMHRSPQRRCYHSRLDYAFPSALRRLALKCPKLCS